MNDKKLQLQEKEGYWAFEYKELDSDEWKEIVIRETKQELLDLTVPLVDEEGQTILDEEGRAKTVLYPFYYEEE